MQDQGLYFTEPNESVWALEASKKDALDILIEEGVIPMPTYFKGPISAFHRALPRRRAFDGLPVARGVVDEESMVRSARPTRRKEAAEHPVDCLCRPCRLKRRGI